MEPGDPPRPAGPEVVVDLETLQACLASGVERRGLNTELVDVRLGPTCVVPAAKLGAGSYGLVLQGVLHGELVAVKVLHPHHQQGAHLAVAEREAAMLKIDAFHRFMPRLLARYAGSAADGTPAALITELCNHTSVEALIEKRVNGRLLVMGPTRIHLMVLMVACVKRLSEAGFTHRDLKVDQFLVDEVSDMFTVRLGDAGMVQPSGQQVQEAASSVGFTIVVGNTFAKTGEEYIRAWVESTTDLPGLGYSQLRTAGWEKIYQFFVPNNRLSQMLFDSIASGLPLGLLVPLGATAFGVDVASSFHVAAYSAIMVSAAAMMAKDPRQRGDPAVHHRITATAYLVFQGVDKKLPDTVLLELVVRLLSLLAEPGMCVALPPAVRPALERIYAQYSTQRVAASAHTFCIFHSADFDKWVKGADVHTPPRTPREFAEQLAAHKYAEADEALRDFTYPGNSTDALPHIRDAVQLKLLLDAAAAYNLSSEGVKHMAIEATSAAVTAAMGRHACGYSTLLDSLKLAADLAAVLGGLQFALGGLHHTAQPNLASLRTAGPVQLVLGLLLPALDEGSAADDDGGAAGSAPERALERLLCVGAAAGAMVQQGVDVLATMLSARSQDSLADLDRRLQHSPSERAEAEAWAAQMQQEWATGQAQPPIAAVLQLYLADRKVEAVRRFQVQELLAFFAALHYIHTTCQLVVDGVGLQPGPVGAGQARWQAQLQYMTALASAAAQQVLGCAAGSGYDMSVLGRMLLAARLGATAAGALYRTNAVVYNSTMRALQQHAGSGAVAAVQAAAAEQQAAAAGGAMQAAAEAGAAVGQGAGAQGLAAAVPNQQDIAAEPAAVPPTIRQPAAAAPPAEPAAAGLPAEPAAAALPAEPAAVLQPAAEPAAGGRCLRRRLAVFRGIAPDAGEAQEAAPAAAPLLPPIPAAPSPQDPLARALAADVAAATPSSTTGAGGQPPGAMTAEQAVHLVQGGAPADLVREGLALRAAEPASGALPAIEAALALQAAYVAVASEEGPQLERRQQATMRRSILECASQPATPTGVATTPAHSTNTSPFGSGPSLRGSTGSMSDLARSAARLIQSGPAPLPARLAVSAPAAALAGPSLSGVAAAFARLGLASGSVQLGSRSAVKRRATGEADPAGPSAQRRTRTRSNANQLTSSAQVQARAAVASLATTSGAGAAMAQQVSLSDAELCQWYPLPSTTLAASNPWLARFGTGNGEEYNTLAHWLAMKGVLKSQDNRDFLEYLLSLMSDFLRNECFKRYDQVPDPYYGGSSGFELVLDLLDDACLGLLDHIQQEQLAANK